MSTGGIRLLILVGFVALYGSYMFLTEDFSKFERFLLVIILAFDEGKQCMFCVRFGVG